jgi:hypothetical protein
MKDNTGRGKTATLILSYSLSAKADTGQLIHSVEICFHAFGKNTISMDSTLTSETPIRTAGAHCCICKEGIEFEVNEDNIAINPKGFDPCGLGLVTNVFGPKNDQREQWFFCHMECFRKMVNDQSMYILEPDFETIGECERERLREVAKAESSAP